jgi:hypothetical protein
VIAVAIDDDAEVVRPWVDGITFPVLLDAHHLLTELYAISNVPTVLWIDEDDTIVRANATEFGTDTFKDFTGIPAEPHMVAVRDWVLNNQRPIDADAARESVGELTDDEVAARLHFRVAAELRRRGDLEDALRHFGRASELAPYDWTIRRAAMPLTGDDPFGERFFALYEEWQKAGSPYHGLRAPIAPGA